MARKSRKNVNVQQAESCRTVIYVRSAMYVRLSVEDNGGRGNSLETQQLIIEDFVENHPEMKTIGAYVDNGASGTNFERPGFQQMLSDIESGKVDCVIVKDLSRLGRNSIDAGYYLEKYFPSHKVRFISVNDNYDSNDGDNLYGGIILPLKNMINEAYALDISKKIKAQQRQAMKSGEYVGGRAPYGFVKDSNNCHKLLVDEEAAAIVRQIFQWASEKVSLEAIAVRLNDAGILPPSQYKQTQGLISHENLIGRGKWQTRTIRKLLDSEVYMGDLVQGKTKSIDHKQTPAPPEEWIVVRDTHEAIISRSLFEAVAEHRSQVLADSKTAPHEPFIENAFKGKLFCGKCGLYLHYQRARRKKGDVYSFRCNSKYRIGDGFCETVSITEKVLRGAVLTSLREQVGELLESISSANYNRNHLDAKSAEIKSAVSKLQGEADNNGLFLRKLYENLVQGILNSEEYFSLKAGYETKIESITLQISELEQSLKKQKAQYNGACDLQGDAKTLDKADDLSTEIIEKLIDRIIVYPDKQIEVILRCDGDLGQLVEVSG